ncbi:MAG: response regulator, partial [Desulfonatronovibrio sp.]
PNMVQGDPGRLRQILMNLVGNAIKFTECGEVEVRVSRMMNDECEMMNSDNDEVLSSIHDSSFITPHSCMLRFMVRDTGIGIPENKKDKLFQSFSQVDASTTRRFGGTGLGLTISKQLAELMEGTVGFESQEVQGSLFWFTVRLGIQDKQQEQPARACLQEVRILIVDDNPTNREILMVRLGSWGMRPQEASDGPSALSMMHQANSDNDSFVVAVLDMMMPDMDGETLGLRIKEDEKLKDTRLIMLSSATGQRGDASRLQNSGFDMILDKPVMPSELHASLQKVLAKPGSIDLMAECTDKKESQAGYPDFSGIKARVLVAEDNMVNQQVALGILKKLGLRADAVANGLEAIHALKNIPYDLVLMDVMMPEMDGLEATRRIRQMMNDESGMLKDQDRSQKSGLQVQKVREDDPASLFSIHHSAFRIPIIAMTAAAMQEDRERCFKAGMDDYLAKPVNPEDLGRILSKWLAEERRQGEVSYQISEVRDQKSARQGQESGAKNGNQETTSCFVCSKSTFDKEDLMERTGHDQEFADEIMNFYLESVPENIKSLKVFIEQGQSEGATRAAHSIKGSSGSISCLAMAEIAENIEEAGHSKDLDKMKTLLPELEMQFTKCMVVINRYLDNSDESAKSRESDSKL